MVSVVAKKFLQPKTIKFSLANILGIAIYLLVASRLWAPRGEEWECGGPGDGMWWLFFAAPVLLVFLAGDFFFLIYALFKVYKDKNWHLIVAVIIMFGAWLGGLGYDASRSYLCQQSFPGPV